MGQFACRALGEYSPVHTPVKHRTIRAGGADWTGCRAPWVSSPAGLSVSTAQYTHQLNTERFVLGVQAVRPDRLQSAMGQFACRALGEYSPVHTPVKHRTIRAGGADWTGCRAPWVSSPAGLSVSTAQYTHQLNTERFVLGVQTGPAAERHGSVRLQGSR